MWQRVIVGLLVVASIGYAAWSLAPAAARRGLSTRTAAWLRRGPRPLRRLAALVERAPGTGSAADGCPGCPAAGRPAGRADPPPR